MTLHIPRDRLALNGTKSRGIGAGRLASPLSILVVNNMPDAALRATERQYCSVFAVASIGMLVDLRFTSLPGVPRHGNAKDHVARFYEDPAAMSAKPPDGLIVTGCEPRFKDLMAETLWPALCELIDWAECNSVPAIWSCLAAHAAVLRLDEIQRVPLKEKLSGVFKCKAELPRHRLLKGCPSVWRIPHSRTNGLDRRALESNGYSILSSSSIAGVDSFIKQDGILQIFFQGHPEYGPETLLAEHRRDIARAAELKRTKQTPSPAGFSRNMRSLGWFKSHATADEIAMMASQSETPAGYPIRHSGVSEWSEIARVLYHNWLCYLEDRRYTDHGQESRVRNLAMQEPEHAHS